MTQMNERFQKHSYRHGQHSRRRAPRRALPHCAHCGKVIHRTRLDALLVLAKRSSYDRGERRVYRCPVQHGWHLTSQAAR